VPVKGSDEGKYSFAKNQRGHLAVEQEIVPFNSRADGAGDHRPTQLAAVLEIGKWNCSDIGCGHRQTVRAVAAHRGLDPSST
jgi:hypothetical protein